MKNQLQTRAFLRKTVDKFISIHLVIQLLKLSESEAFEFLTNLETLGYIEKSRVDETYWIISARGKLLTYKILPKEFKIETLNKHLDNLLERATIVNTSDKFPDQITCIKIVSQYPMESRDTGIIIAYTLNRKQITQKQYEKAAHLLRTEYKGTFGNIPEYIYYPHKAIKLFLKSGSKVLKLKEYSLNDFLGLNGQIVFDNNSSSSV